MIRRNGEVMDTTFNLTDKNNEASRRNGISHVVDILKAAFPYLDSDSQQSVDLFVKTGELISTVTELNNHDHPVASLSVRRQSIDLEALLTSVRTVCYPREREFIDVILNMFKAKNLYQTYATLSQVMASQSQGAENFEGFENGSGTDSTDSSSNLGNMFGMNGNPAMMEMLSSMLTPEQKSTFDNLSMILNSMPT